MRVLLDECVPVRLSRYLVGHDVATVRDQRWQGASNGQLLALVVAAGFQVMVTTDKNLRYQQSMRSAGMAVFVLRAYKNDLPSLVELVPALMSALETARAGDLTELGPLARPT